MKTVWKVLLSLGAVLIAVGVTVLIIGYAMNDWHSVNANFDVQSMEFEGVTKLDVESDALDIEFEFYDGEKLHIDYPVREGYLSAESSQVEDTVRFESEYLKKYHSFGFFGKNPPPVTVKIPSSYEPLNITVNSGAGNVKLAAGTYGNLDIDLAAGNFKMKEITAQNLKINLDVGNVTANSVKCNKLTASLDCGNFTVDKVECPDISVENDCGNVQFAVVGARTEYNITAHCDLGNCELQERDDPAAEKRLSVDVSLGNLQVTFTQS